MKIQILFKAKDKNSVNYTKKRDGHVTNLYELEDTRLQDGVEIYAMIYASTLHQYYTMELNNESHPSLLMVKFHPKMFLPVSTLTSPSVT